MPKVMTTYESINFDLSLKICIVLGVKKVLKGFKGLKGLKV